MGWIGRAADRLQNKSDARWQQRQDERVASGQMTLADLMVGRSKPLPLWSRLVLCLVWIAIVALSTAGLLDKRGVVLGVIGAVVYGLLAPGLILAWGRMTALPKRYQMLYVWIFYPLLLVTVLFLGIAFQTKLPTAICLLIALLAGLLVVAVGRHVRRSRQHKSR